MVNLKIRLRTIFLTFFIFTSLMQLTAEELFFLPPDEIIVTRKFNVSLYIDQRYKGHVYRESRTSMKEIPGAGSSIQYKGSYYQFEETKRDMVHVERSIQTEIPVSFALYSNGAPVAGFKYPDFGGIPVLPQDNVEIGDKWKDFGYHVLQIPGRDNRTTVRIYCEYTYLGPDTYKGEEVLAVKAQYALRYKNDEDPTGDQDIKRVDGKHELLIYLSDDGTTPLFMRDTMDDYIQMKTGQVIRQKGFILTWFNWAAGLSKQSVVTNLIDSLKEDESLEITSDDDGIHLSLQDLQFKPNSPELLPGQENRLNTIAKLLIEHTPPFVLVTGHAADVGSPEWELELSRQRAETIAKALGLAGVNKDTIIFQGKGSTEPVADNTTEEGRSRNRRVEITLRGYSD